VPAPIAWFTSNPRMAALRAWASTPAQIGNDRLFTQPGGFGSATVKVG
jgi:hypothetical protein